MTFEFSKATISIDGCEPFEVEGVRIETAKAPATGKVTIMPLQRVRFSATFELDPGAVAGWKELAASLPPLTLTSADPEPPVGTVVTDSCGGTWINSGCYPAAWMHPGSSGGAYDDVETWTKIAGNYGPVTVQEWGDDG